MKPVLGIDPGTRKCGYAVVVDASTPPLDQGIVTFEELAERMREVVVRFEVRAVALGGGTHAVPVAQALHGTGLQCEIVDERETTLRARARYFRANPPRGWKRLVPRGLLLPPCPIDDFAAILIAERYLEQEAEPA